MTPLLHIEVIVFYKAVLLIHSVCCLTNRPIGCISMENSPRCFTVYDKLDERRDHQQASEVCHSEHNGKLAVIEDEATQTELSNLIRRVHKGNYYWIGVKLKLLDNWTWLDGTQFSDGTNLNFKTMTNDAKGYARLKKWQSMTSDTPARYAWDVTTIPFNDPITPSDQSLCECKTTDCIAKCKGRYFTSPARRWFTGRNKCVAFGGDLAVLTSDDFSDPQLQSIVRENINYFIGLSNVRMKSTEIENDIKYTNWSPLNPRNESENCVAINSNSNGQWTSWNCHRKTQFICEHGSRVTTMTTFASATVAESFENDVSTSKMTKAENDAAIAHEPLFLILGVLVVLIVIAVVIITAAVCYIRTKTADRFRESYTGLDSRNGGTLQGSGGPAGYSAISQQRPTSNIPDVCYSASTGAAAYVDEGPQYAEVSNVRKNASPVTAATGEEYANLPQTQAPAKDKNQPTDDNNKKKPKSVAAAAATTTPAHVEESGGTEYACILPSQQSRSTPPGNVVEQNVYELASEPVEYATLA